MRRIKENDSAQYKTTSVSCSIQRVFCFKIYILKRFCLQIQFRLIPHASLNSVDNLIWFMYTQQRWVIGDTFPLFQHNIPFYTRFLRFDFDFVLRLDVFVF